MRARRSELSPTATLPPRCPRCRSLRLHRPCRRSRPPRHDLTLRILDQHRAGLGDELAVAGGGQGAEERRQVLGPLSQHARGGAHGDRGPCLAGGDVDAEHARAVLTLGTSGVPGGIEHHHRHRLVAGLSGALQREGDDLVGLVQGDVHESTLVVCVSAVERPQARGKSLVPESAATAWSEPGGCHEHHRQAHYPGRGPA